MSDSRARTDDFRCYDPRLVQIVPGRVDEAVETALALAGQGLCDGVFVQGHEVAEWSFLERVSGLDRFVFAGVHPSFASVDLGDLLCNAIVLGISGNKVPLDLSRFERLKELGYQWHSHPVALESRPVLGQVRLRGVPELGQDGLRLPGTVELLWIVKLAGEELKLDGPVDCIEDLQLAYAPQLRSLPTLPGLRRIELDHAGNAAFDYDSIPAKVEDLTITAGAPIVSWDFLQGCPHLKYLNIEQTKCAAPDPAARERLMRIESLNLPRQVAASLKGA